MGLTHFTFRWNVFAHGEGTGGLIVNGNNVRVYGNVFINLPAENSLWTGNGAFATWSWGACTNCLIYNNSFIDVGRPIGEGGSGTLTGDFRNNIFYSTNPFGDSIDQLAHDYNHYVDMMSISEPNGTTGAGDPFTNYHSLDFHLTTATPPGDALPAPYGVDMFGNTRGADGSWDRGALEFTGGGSPPSAPSAPTNVRILP